MRTLNITLMGIGALALLWLGGRTALQSVRPDRRVPVNPSESEGVPGDQPAADPIRTTAKSGSSNPGIHLRLGPDGGVTLDGTSVPSGELLGRLGKKSRRNQENARPGTPSPWDAVLEFSPDAHWRWTQRVLRACAHPTVGIGTVTLRAQEFEGRPFEQRVHLTVMDPIEWFWRPWRRGRREERPPWISLRIGPAETGRGFRVSDGYHDEDATPTGFRALMKWVADEYGTNTPLSEHVGCFDLEPDVPTLNLIRAVRALRSIGVRRFDFDHTLPRSWETADLIRETEDLPPAQAALRLIEALGRVGEEFSSRDITPESTVADTAHARLVDMGTDAVPALAKALRHEVPVIRSRAARALWYIGPPATVPVLDHLIDAFADENAIYYAGLAVDDMGHLAVPKLLEAMRRPERYVRYAAASRLRDLEVKGAVPAFITALGDEFYLTRLFAAEGLESLSHRSAAARKALEPLLRDEYLSVRVQAARTWFVAGGEARRSLWVFLLAMKNGDDLARRAAASGIVLMGDQAAAGIPRILSLLRAGPGRECAATALGGIGPPAAAAVEELLLALRDRDKEVRNEAAIALGRIQAEPERVVPALLAALEGSPPGTRPGAAEGLGYLLAHAKRTVPALRRAMAARDFDCLKCRAAESLIRLGYDRPAAVEVIVEQFLDSMSIYNLRLPAALAGDPEARSLAIDLLTEAQARTEGSDRKRAAAALARLRAR